MQKTNTAITREGGVPAKHRLDVQGLRTLAVLSVIFFHSGLPIPGGFVGVDMFFVISGFVITLTLKREWQRNGEIDLKRFYLNRFKRLIPALALVVSITIFLSIFFLSPLTSQVKVSTATGLGSVLMIANVVIDKLTGGYFETAASDNPLTHTWSLSVEEQFYLAFPIILVISFYAAKKFRRSTSAPMFIVAGFTVLSYILMTLVMTGQTSEKLAHLLGFYSPLARAWEFGLGAIAALLGEKFKTSSTRIATIFGILGLILILYSFFFISGKDAYPGPLTLIPCIGTILLILVGNDATKINPITKFLALTPMVKIGDISYSWYLWHWPAIVFTSANFGPSTSYLTTAALLSVAPAIASYFWLENPLREKKLIGAKNSIKFIISTLTPPIAICLLVFTASKNGYWFDDIIRYQKLVDTYHSSVRAGCGYGYVPSSLPDKACTWNAAQDGTPLYLIGDSNADHFSEALIAASTKLGSPVTIVTKGGCAFVGRSWGDRNDIAQEQCLNFVDKTMTLLGNSTPGVVIFSISDSNWYKGLSVGPSRLEETNHYETAINYVSNEYRSTVQRMLKQGHKVLLLQPVPKFVTLESKVMFDNAKCTAISILNHSCPQKVETTIAYQNEFQIGRATQYQTQL